MNEIFRQKYEPYAADYQNRIAGLRFLHEKGFKTWVSIEPYPTPNIIDQDFLAILDAVSFADRIIFGKLNYNSKVREYKDSLAFYNSLSKSVIEYCLTHHKEYHIKEGTLTNCASRAE